MRRMSQVAALATESEDTSLSAEQLLAPDMIDATLSGGRCNPEPEVPLIDNGQRLGCPCSLLKRGRKCQMSTRGPAALTYIQIARTWPAHYRTTPISQLRTILNRGKLLQKATDALVAEDRGGKLVASLFDLYSTQTSATMRQLTTVIEVIRVAARRRRRDWYGDLGLCRTVSRMFNHDVAYYIGGKSPAAIDPAAIPIEGRLAHRTGAGTANWCVYTDNVSKNVGFDNRRQIGRDGPAVATPPELYRSKYRLFCGLHHRGMNMYRCRCNTAANRAWCGDLPNTDFPPAPTEEYRRLP